MIKLLLLFTLALSLNASKILSYNIYDRTDRADVMITFDTPYDGTIKQSISKSKIIIKLQNATIESEKSKQLSSSFLHSITIMPKKSDTIIIASIPSSTTLKASKTSDGYGLRLRFSKKNIAKNTTTPLKQDINPFAALPTKKDSGMQKNYFIVIAILVIGILILFFIKKRIPSNSKSPKPNTKNSWLFKANEKNANSTLASANNVSIRFQKNINSDNSVVMLDFGAQSYLVFMGKSNILLDKFTDNKPVTEEDFETILQNRNQELTNFIKDENQDTSYEKEPLQAYKERAASIIYES